MIILLVLKVFTASLDPSNENYIAKVLNTDPDKFEEEEHLLWADFAIEQEIAPVDRTASSVAIISGSNSTNPIGTSQVWRDSFGRFDTRYQSPRTPMIISQPFGRAEHSLFHFECLDDVGLC